VPDRISVRRGDLVQAEVVLEGADFDGAKDAARRRADDTGAMFIEDGAVAPIAEGAGTIALELCRMETRIDAVLVPLGDGALVTGVGLWMKRESPSTRVIGVVPEGAPAMEMSWRARRPVSTPTMDTIADGIAVRVPVPDSLEIMRTTVDDVMLVTDAEIVDAMRMLHRDAGLVVEPAGAAGIAAVAKRRDELAGKRVAVPLTGGNVTEEQLRKYLY